MVSYKALTAMGQTFGSVFYTVGQKKCKPLIEDYFCDRYLDKQDVWGRTDINPSLTLAVLSRAL